MGKDGEEAGNPGGNPGEVTMDLCKAYRAAIHSEVKSIKNQIIGALAISTAIITLVMYLLKPL